MTSMDTHNNQENDHDRVWHNIRRLDTDVSGLRVSVGSMEATLKTLGDQQTRIEQIVSRPKAGFNWGWFVAGATFLALILGSVVTVLKADISRLEHYQELGMMQVIENKVAYVELQGRLDTDAKTLDVLKELIETRHDSLKEKMKLADDLVHERVDGVRRVVERHEIDLNSRKGIRFNRPDWEEGKNEILRYIDSVTRDRFTGERGAMLQKQVDEIKQEQMRRTPMVFGSGTSN